MSPIHDDKPRPGDGPGPARQSAASVPWLSRPSSIRVLWIAFGVVLALTVLAQFAIALHPHFVLDRVFAFNAIFGFASCVGMVLFAKALGWLLKRRDDYYRSSNDGASGDD